jgi:photosystem II stability/assembly factor-like uncharacterized protein
MCTLCFFVALNSASAQPKGHWERTFLYAHSTPTCVVAVDSLRAFLLLAQRSQQHPQVLFKTVDGGKTWQQTELDSNSMHPLSDNIFDQYHTNSVLADGGVAFTNQGYISISNDEGISWRFLHLQTLQLDFAFAGLKSFNENLGLVFTQAFRGFSLGDSLSAYELRDSGQTSNERSAVYVGTQSLRDALFLDSLNGCAWLDGQGSLHFIWTSDGGYTWEERTRLPYLGQYYSFIVGPPDQGKILML